MNHVTYNDFDIIKADKLYLPKTPAAWCGNPTYTPITRIRISCGGGMGGAQWFEYVLRHDKPDTNRLGLAEYTRWNGKPITINPAFIVSAEDFTLVTATYDSRNTNFAQGLYKVRLLAEDGHKITLVNSFN